jgi:hypothetical protein
MAEFSKFVDSNPDISGQRLTIFENDMARKYKF